MSKELLKKSGLHRAAPLNDRLRPLGADEQGLSTVALDRLAPQIALAHELINIHRDKVGLDAPNLHDVARRPVAGVVGKKHQNVKGGLRQLQLAAKRLAGGGMMMLLILTSVLGYELKTAVGTSVFIMAFTALTGAVSHFAIGGAPDWTVFALCVLFTLVWARIAAVFANKASPKTLNRATGVVLVILGVVIMLFNVLA